MVKTTMAMIQKGINLPRMKSRLRMGVTLICSMVPVSRSFTMLRALSMPPIMVTRMARMPGMKAIRWFRSGLNRPEEVTAIPSGSEPGA